MNYPSLIQSAPHNPENKPLDPGYRFLSGGESSKETDETWGNGTEKWLSLRHMHDEYGHPLAGRSIWTIRRALCVDDQYAPPPNQWSIDGWEVFRGDRHELRKGCQIWQSGCLTGWHHCVESGYTKTAGPFYYRRKVPGQTSNQSLKPGQSIVVYVGDSKVLSQAVKQVAVEAGYLPLASNSVLAYIGIHGRGHPKLTGPCMSHDITLSWYNREDPTHVYLDARTDMGKLIDLLSPVQTPNPKPKLVPPTVNGHVARYNPPHKTPAGGIGIYHSIEFGCAKISIPMLRKAKEMMDGEWVGCNRTAKTIILDSGVVLTKEDIDATLAYVDAINQPS
jgi:hypothetical protein